MILTKFSPVLPILYDVYRTHLHSTILYKIKLPRIALINSFVKNKNMLQDDTLEVIISLVNVCLV